MKNILISLCCFGIICSAVVQTAQMVHDSQNIKALFEAMSKAWNIHDAKAYSMAFLEEADFTDVLGISVYGRDSIEKVHEKSFATIFKNSSLKITGKKIRYVTNDLTAVDVWWEMNGAKNTGRKKYTARKRSFKHADDLECRPVADPDHA